MSDRFIPIEEPPRPALRPAPGRSFPGRSRGVLPLLVLLSLAVGCTNEGRIFCTDVDDDDTDGPALELTTGEWRLHDVIESMVYVSWEQSAAAPAWVEYTFEDDRWYATPRFDADAGAHEQILLGIPFGSEVRWRVVAEAGGEEVSAEGEMAVTGPVPPGLPVGVITASEPGAWDPSGNYFLSSICQATGSWNPGNYWTFIVDRRGRPVWANVAPDEHWTIFAQLSRDGTAILWDESTYWLNWGSNHGIGSKIHRQYLDEEIEVRPADGIVHAFVELPDGTLAWGSEFHVQGTEALVELAPGEDEATVVWTCADDYPGSPAAYCSSNGLFYEASTDSYLYSFWDESVVVEVDRASGENLWWAGGIPGGYQFVPPTSRFDFQHGVSYTDDGTLLLHSGQGMGGGGHGVSAREYEVDHDAETLTEVWRHESDGGGLGMGVLNGDVWRLAGGNTLHTLGSGGLVKEITPDGEEVWVLDFQSERLLGSSALIEDLYDLVSPP